MKHYTTPTFEVVHINSRDIIATSVTSTQGNVFSGQVTGGHGDAMAPGRRRIWEN